jgi:hypothetical protein
MRRMDRRGWYAFFGGLVFGFVIQIVRIVNA